MLGTTPACPLQSPSQDVSLMPGPRTAGACAAPSLVHAGNFFNGAVAAAGAGSPVFIAPLLHNRFDLICLKHQHSSGVSWEDSPGLPGFWPLSECVSGARPPFHNRHWKLVRRTKVLASATISRRRRSLLHPPCRIWGEESRNECPESRTKWQHAALSGVHGGAWAPRSTLPSSSGTGLRPPGQSGLRQSTAKSSHAEDSSRGASSFEPGARTTS